jgi:hypothetical protein
MSPLKFKGGDLVRTFVQVDELHQVSITTRKATARICCRMVQTPRLESNTRCPDRLSQSSTEALELERDRPLAETIPS